MAKSMQQWVEDVKASFARMSGRDRAMLGLLGVVALALVVGGFAYAISPGLEEIEQENAGMRKALRAIHRKRDLFMARRQAIQRVESRMSESPLDLNAHVEQAANAAGVTIAESDAAAPVVGDRYVERSVNIKVKKVNVVQLQKLLEALESAPAHIVQVRGLSVNTRWNQNDVLDLDITVSTFDRNPEAGKPRKGGRRGRKRS